MEKRGEWLKCLRDANFQEFLAEVGILKGLSDPDKTDNNLHTDHPAYVMRTLYNQLRENYGRLISRYDLASVCYGGLHGKSEILCINVNLWYLKRHLTSPEELFSKPSIGVGLGVQDFKVGSAHGLLILYSLWSTPNKRLSSDELSLKMFGESSPYTSQLTRQNIHTLNTQLPGTLVSVTNNQRAFIKGEYSLRLYDKGSL